MNNIIFDFEGTKIELEPSMGLVIMVATKKTKFSFNGEIYVVEDSTVVGIEESAKNQAKRRELLKEDQNHNGDLPQDVIEMIVKMKKA